MLLEDYFDFLAPDDIRIKGTRIGIESVLDLYANHGMRPEEIDERFWTVTLEQVYATILYYYHNKEAATAYLEDYLEYCRRSEEEFDRNPPPGFEELRQRIEADRVQDHAKAA